MNAKRGFTLIELLVVIGIIAVIGSILFPVFARVREKARQITCLSNLRQIGMATMQYVQDNDETFLYAPFPGDIDNDPNRPVLYPPDMLYPYTKSVQIWKDPDFDQGYPYWMYTNFIGSPSAPPQFQQSPCVKSLGDYQLGYGLNELLLADALQQTPTTLSQVNSPSEIGMFSDSSTLWNTFYGYMQDLGTGRKTYWLSSDQESWFYGTPRHNDGANFCYADGHAKWAKLTITKESPVFWGYYNVRINPQED